MDNNLIPKSRMCQSCGLPMHLSFTTKCSDGIIWRCQRKGHSLEKSIRAGSWFDKSNLTITEILELTYLWSTGVEQSVIIQQMGLSPNTAVDWDMFCREVCEVVILKKIEPIGGEGIRVQIDESKFGKRKYHRGHRVEGQWVFGGIEESSRKNFMVPVEKRDRNTLLPIIQKFIKPGTTIISDYWKAYDILSKKDYKHLKVNHSIEFVNESGSKTKSLNKGYEGYVGSTTKSLNEGYVGSKTKSLNEGYEGYVGSKTKSLNEGYEGYVGSKTKSLNEGYEGYVGSKTKSLNEGYEGYVGLKTKSLNEGYEGYDSSYLFQAKILTANFMPTFCLL
ncbi:nacrein-like protein C1 [Clytia hemisphaerica]|uniref:nacrein-like protein C1 n=1 Tax=Clytia hemisphaerica TaxID=252671 RepID=UPI0034D6CB95